MTEQDLSRWALLTPAQRLARYRKLAERISWLNQMLVEFTDELGGLALYMHERDELTKEKD